MGHRADLRGELQPVLRQLRHRSRRDAPKPTHKRYGVTERRHRARAGRSIYPTASTSAMNPNEPLQVRLGGRDRPDDPTSTPIKRTALGASSTRRRRRSIAADRPGRRLLRRRRALRLLLQVRHATSTYDPTNRARRTWSLLDEGTLYVAQASSRRHRAMAPARLRRPRDAVNGIGLTSQADACIDTRQAGDAVGATKMDRPEDIEMNPMTGKVYWPAPTTPTAASVPIRRRTAANPRVNNRYGHIIEFVESGGDQAARRRSPGTSSCSAATARRRATSSPTRRRRRRTRAPTSPCFDQRLDPDLRTPTTSPSTRPATCSSAPTGPRTVNVSDGTYLVPTAGTNHAGKLLQLLAVPAGAGTPGRR